MDSKNHKKKFSQFKPCDNLTHHITDVSHTEFVIKLSHFITEKIPIYILPPTGEAPLGYQFLDVQPSEIFQTVSGPEEQVLQLKTKGLELALV